MIDAPAENIARRRIEVERDGLRTQLAELQKLLANQASTVRVLEAERERLRGEPKRLREEIERHIWEYRCLTQATADSAHVAETKLKEALAECGTLREQVAHLGKEIDRQTAVLDTVTKERDECSARYLDQSCRNNALSRACAQYAAELEALRKEYHRLQRKLESAERENQILRDEVAWYVESGRTQ